MRLLDTTLLVDFMRRKPEAQQVVQRMEDTEERRATTEVNAFELTEGAFPEGKLHRAKFAHVQQVLGRLDVLGLDRAGALRAAEVAAGLRAEGRMIGILDVLVAGIALASGFDTIVTRDEDFRHVPGLRVETY
jgi:predicted nucleic acid-binding protein